MKVISETPHAHQIRYVLVYLLHLFLCFALAYGNLEMLRCCIYPHKNITLMTKHMSNVFVHVGDSLSECYLILNVSVFYYLINYFIANCIINHIDIIFNCIGVAMVCVLVSIAVNRAFESRSGQTKDY